MVGFEGTEISPSLASLLARIQPAGVILFARNIESLEQTWRLLKACRERVTAPLFTSVDLEGGTVDRFRKVIGPTPSAASVFGSGNRKLFRKHGQLIGQACRGFGFNLDFVPVLDLAFSASRAVMSSRAVSADPRQVTLYGRQFLAGLQAAGVIGAGKHFPGLGEANLDTHHELPSVKKSLQKMWEEDLYPYRALRGQLPLVLVGHASYTALRGHHSPASLSGGWIGEILKNKIGYRGLVVSDDLEMGGVLKAAPIEEAALAHIEAGGDLCLICRQQELVERAYARLMEAAERDPKFRARALQSARRVMAFKAGSRAVRKKFSPPGPNLNARLARALWNFSEEVEFGTIQFRSGARQAQS
ncbi:MAG: beta-N-acetylhexosaminidase [Acidobacteria bacterium]|nr:MAG: beta-N-acetylhexosaminidase [Acidobacteriota bacterium]